MRKNIQALPEQYIVVFTVKDRPYGYCLDFYPSNADALPRLINEFVELLENKGEKVLDYWAGVFRPFASSIPN